MNASSPKIDLRLWRDLTQRDLDECDELEAAVSATADPESNISQRLSWAPADPDATWVVRVWHDSLLVSFVAVMERVITVDGREAKAAGIRGLRTHPQHRRRGFGRLAMVRATEFIKGTLKPDLALLLSSTMAVPFYEKLGWRAMRARVYCEQDEGTTCYSDVIPEAPAMVLAPPSMNLPWREVHLRGFPW